jgi:peptidyl-prolyl cis-trans isomerase C
MKWNHLIRVMTSVVSTLGLLMTINLLAGHELISVSFAAEDFIIATVNGLPIMKSELDNTISTYKKEAKKKEVSQEEEKQLVKNLIRRRLILQQDAVQSLKQDEYIIKKVKRHEDDLIIGQFLRDEVGGKLRVNDDEIRKYYQENRHKFSLPRKVQASHILLRTKEEAEKVLARLKKGEDFVQLAKDFSIDLPDALKGGSMGIIEKGKILPELDKVLFTLGEGEFSDVVGTIFGYHILKVDKVIPAGFRPFEQVKDDIKRVLIREKEADAYNALATRLEKGADIKIFENLLYKEDSSTGKEEQHTH